MCIVQSGFETKPVDYLIYNVVDEIFICKVGLEFKSKKKKMCLISNHV